jgi:hypothetical protein
LILNGELGCTRDDDCESGTRCIEDFYETFCFYSSVYPPPLTNGEVCGGNFDCDITGYFNEAVCLEGECRLPSPEGGPCVERDDCDVRSEYIDDLIEVVCENRIC